MTSAKIGKWGANLALRVPLDIVRATGLQAGEGVVLEVRDGDIVVRRMQARAVARAEALAAAAEILSERKKHPLGGVDIRELIDEGRR
jgi:antitoxin component of MazEF toxin-antitoxin module